MTFYKDCFSVVMAMLLSACVAMVLLAYFLAWREHP